MLLHTIHNTNKHTWTHTHTLTHINMDIVNRIDIQIEEISLEIKDLADLLHDNLVNTQPPPKEYEYLYSEIKRLAQCRQHLYDAKYDLQ